MIVNKENQSYINDMKRVQKKMNDLNLSYENITQTSLERVKAVC